MQAAHGHLWYLDPAAGPLDQTMPIPPGVRYVQVSAPNAFVDVYWLQGASAVVGTATRAQRVAANDTGIRLIVPCGAATHLRVQAQAASGTLTVAFSPC